MKVKARFFNAVLIFISMLGTPTYAQFAGDVFFTTPSVMVAEGGEAILEVAAFSGAQVLGASHFEISFDQKAVKIVDVVPGVNTEFSDGFNVDIEGGKIKIVVLNTESPDTPIGTSSIASIRVRPTVPAGSIITFQNNVITVLDSQSTAFANATGFGAELVVVPASFRQEMVRSDRTVLQLTSKDADYQRLAVLAPLGATVKTYQMNQDGEVVERFMQALISSSEKASDSQ